MTSNFLYMYRYIHNHSNNTSIIHTVPAIISTGASPTDCEPSHQMVDLKTPLPAKRQGRPLQKVVGSEQIIIDMGHHHHQIQPHWQTNSEESTYCSRCGGATSHERRNLAKKRYFSLDKERNEKTTNFLQCYGNTGICVSDNILANSRKQCSFETNSEDTSTSKRRVTKSSNNNVNYISSNNNNNNSNGAKLFLSTIRQTCDQCDMNTPNRLKDSANGGICMKNCIQHTECATSCSNQSFRDKSNKSSQNSLRESRTGRKTSCMQLNVSETDGCGGGISDRPKPKRISSQHSRKTSTRATSLNLHEEQDSETREILLGTTTTTSYSKFDKLPEIKIPEPVEAVCSIHSHSLVSRQCVCAMQPHE